MADPMKKEEVKMKKMILLALLMISSLAFSMARMGTEVGNIAPTIKAEGFVEGSNLGKLTVLKFWQST